MNEFDILSVKRSKDVKEMLSGLVEKQRDLKHVTNREFMSYDEVESVEE